MNLKPAIGVIVIILLFGAIFAFYQREAGFTPWMTYREMDAFLKPLEVKNEAGKNFWDQGHWLNAVEGRWHAGQPQFRLRVGDAPKSGPRWWYWWFNQDQASFNKHIHDMSDDNFVMVSSNSFQWPDGSTRYSGVWHRVGKQPSTPTPAPTPVKTVAETQALLEKRTALLVGKWIDENATVEYRADGLKFAQYDNGFKTQGSWSLDGDIVSFIPGAAEGGRPTRHKIISLTADELVIQSLPDMKIYHAKRVR